MNPTNIPSNQNKLSTLAAPRMNQVPRWMVDEREGCGRVTLWKLNMVEHHHSENSYFISHPPTGHGFHSYVSSKISCKACWFDLGSTSAPFVKLAAIAVENGQMIHLLFK